MGLRWGSSDMQSGGRLRGGRAALSEARRARREVDGDERTVSQQFESSLKTATIQLSCHFFYILDLSVTTNIAEI
jgi:hypothetical protein